MAVQMLRKVGPAIEKGINAAANSKFSKWAFNERAGNIFATVALASTTTKDAVNCVYYTKQSLNNEKIPEEKRKFVAAIDLSNGVMNVLSQLTIARYIKNKIPVWYDAMSKGSKLPDATKNIARSGFTILGTLITAQILLKRVLTPFVATPVAHYIKEYADKRMGNKKPDTTESNDKKLNINSYSSDFHKNELSPTFKAFMQMMKQFNNRSMQ